MDKEEFKNFVETKSVHKMVRDTYGNYKGTLPDGTTIRYKIQKNSVRYERRYETGWYKVWSEYFSNLEINPETGKLRRIKK